MDTKCKINAKTPITELQELCVARKSPHPIYEFTGEESDGLNPNAKIFTTSVTALGFTCVGKGRSKRDSKHDAAFKLKKLLFEKGECDDNIEDDEHFLSVLSSDKVTEVRDICVQRNYEMPEFECVRSSGPSHAPEFEYECRIGQIVRRGVHKTKKGAKQAACNEMVKTLQAMPVEDFEMQVQSLDQTTQAILEEDEHTIRTYRELINSDIKKKTGVCLSDRHRFFEEHDHTKIYQARLIVNDEFMHLEDKCISIPKVLGLKYELKVDNSNMLTINGQKLCTFELLSTEFDCYIFGRREIFFHNVYEYFKNMLNLH